MRLKIIGAVAGLIVVLALSAWVWETMKWKRETQLELAESKRKLEAAQAQVEAVKAELNTATTTITELKARRPGEQVVFLDVPADCQKCFKNHKISIKTDSGKGWWSYTDPDVLDGQPGELDLTPKFWTDTVGPYKAAVEDCRKRLKNGIGKPKFLRKGLGIGVEAFASLAGLGGAVEWHPLEVGGTTFSIMPLARISYANGVPGLTDPQLQVLAGLRVEIGRPK